MTTPLRRSIPTSRLRPPLFTQVDAIGRSPMIVRPRRVLKAHRAEISFLEDYLHALKYLADPPIPPRRWR